LEVQADNIAKLWDRGFGHKILLSNDICNLSQLNEYGGPGYANVIENFLELLTQRGLGETEINQMLVSNPAQAFSYTPYIDPKDLTDVDCRQLVEDQLKGRGPR